MERELSGPEPGAGPLEPVGETAPGPARTFAGRLGAALRFDATVYDEVEGDPRALAQAAVVVTAAALARGIGAFPLEQGAGLVGSAVVGWIAWLGFSFVVWIVGVKTFQCTSDYRELLRTLGFAAAPLLGLVVCALPLGSAAPLVWIALHAAALAAFVVAARSALDVSWSRAVLISSLAIASIATLIVVLGILLLDTVVPLSLPGPPV